MTMQNYYRINVALKGKHFFATAEGSVTDHAQMMRVAMELERRFPKTEGYEVTCSHWKASGQHIDFRSIALDVTESEIVAAYNLHPDSMRMIASCSGATTYTDASGKPWTEFHCITTDGVSIEIAAGTVATMVHYRRRGYPLSSIANSHIVVEFNANKTYNLSFALN